MLNTTLGLVYFDGNDLVLAPPSTPSRAILHFATPVFGSFTIAAGANAVLFGESSSGGLWLVPLTGPRPLQPLAQVALNFDALLWDGQRALISAKTGGFSAPDNEILCVDLGSGTTQLVLQVPGASGPLARSANGDLFYGTAALNYPPPVGSASILRFSRSAVDQAIIHNLILGAGSATVSAAGLDAASDLAFDDDGDLFFTDWVNGRIGEVRDADGPQPMLSSPLMDYGFSGISAATLQFQTGSDIGVFEPFQPENGHLLVHETDYFAVNRLRAIAAVRPLLTTDRTSPIPSGPLPLLLRGAPANGFAVVAFALTMPSAPVLLQLPGFEAPLPWNSALLTNPALLPLVLDATGRRRFTIVNPGFAPSMAGLLQVAVVSATGAIGSTAELTVTLTQ